MKTELKKKFKLLYPNKRLLAIQLNGFSHKVFYDEGTAESHVQTDEFSGCMPEGNWKIEATKLFNGIGHNSYQGNAKEYVYINPTQR